MHLLIEVLVHEGQNGHDDLDSCRALVTLQHLVPLEARVYRL